MLWVSVLPSWSLLRAPEVEGEPSAVYVLAWVFLYMCVVMTVQLIEPMYCW